MFLKRESEIKRAMSVEIENYLSEQKEFYSNPLNWTNNKRRMMGLSTLRGCVNKNRVREYPSFRVPKKVFDLIAEYIVEVFDQIYADDIANFVSVNGEEIIEEKERSHDNG